MIIGLPRMHKETAELRDFLPDFVASLSHHDVDGIVIEEGYGSGMGFRIDNYLRASSKVEKQVIAAGVGDVVPHGHDHRPTTDLA